jgi:D-xylose transport system substrate-binding protein
MKTCVRNAAVVLGAISTAVALTACGQADGSGADGGEDTRIGLLMPSTTTARWETRDTPLLESGIKKLCGGCTVEHANAKGDAATQRQQVNSMITKGVDAMVLVTVDARALGPAVRNAEQADIPVIAYDRLAEGPISGLVSFDGEEVGRLQATALLKGMGAAADGGQIVMMNGDPSDPNAAEFKKGALSVLDDRVKIGKMYDTPEWRAETANKNMSAAVSALGADAIDGVYAANDGLAAGSIAALRAHNVSPLPPVTGQDAELQALQRLVAGDQYMTVYKPFESEASAGAAMAVAAARGDSVEAAATGTARDSSGKTIPATLLAPEPVTLGTIEDTVVKDGVYTVEQICTPQFMAACTRAGLTE